MAVKDAIEANASGGWVRPLYSQWSVDTFESVQARSDRLAAVIAENDRLFICDIRRSYQG